MGKFIFGLALLVLAGSLAATSPAQDRDDRRDRDDRHDNGKHKGRDKHGDDDRDDRHDNGRHKGWEKQEIRDEHRDWDADHDRFRPGHSYPYGRYERVRNVFVARRIDFHTRRVVLYDNSNWVVAPYDLDRCRDWAWDRDEVYVYDDDHHPGWYLLFNVRLGRYVHVEYFGLH